MKTASLKLKRGMTSITLAKENPLRIKILNLLLLSLATLVFLYVFFLGKMVFGIVERKALENEARILTNEVNDLELLYLASTDKIDLNFSYALGFKEVAPQYATRKAFGSLGLLSNEI